MSERMVSDRLVSRPQVEGWPLIGLAILMIGSILLAGYAQWQKSQQRLEPIVHVLASRSLIFTQCY